MTNARKNPRVVLVLAGALAVAALVVAVAAFQQTTQPSVLPGATKPSVLPGNVVSWIQGVVSVGLPCPSASVGPSSCPSRPLAGAVIEQRFADGGTATTTSQKDGSYAFVQPGGGTFTILAEPVQGVAATPRPVIISVAPGSGVHVDLRYIEDQR